MKTEEAMGKEEAVRRIDFIEQCECNERDRMALNMGADALKKQIPMKPIANIDCCSRKKYICRACDNPVSPILDDKYCSECGQAIDWSNEDV